MIRGRYRWQLVGNSIKSGRGEQKNATAKNYLGLSIVLVLVFGWLLSRAFFLQVVLGERNRKLADSNRIDVRVVPADRGVIVDRRGAVLARNTVNEDKKLVREYPYGESVANIIGYVGSSDVQGQLLEGKAGVEKSFENELKGQAGRELVEENARGQELDSIRQIEPVGGVELKLTIDAELNKKIDEILKNRETEKENVKAAVVVSRVAGGEILGLMSWPTYDDNLFSGLKPQLTDRYQTVDQVITNTADKPLFNRAISGAYPPGSVFKPIVATGGLEDGKIAEDTMVTDTGELKVGIYRYGNWYFDQYGRTEGAIGVTRALARSNDIFFYKVGEWLGVDAIEKWSIKFGLGKKTGIDIPGEVPGLVPNRLAKERLTGERWFLGDTYHLAIGQGDTLVTPLQVNMFTSAIVTGKLCRPMITNEHLSPMNTNYQCKDLGISQKTRDIVIKGMEEVCQSGGTAFTFFDFATKYGVQPACKTGTAQHGGVDTVSHAWITLVIPKGGDYTQGVAITVLLEEAGEGSYEAGPVSTQIAEYMMENKLVFDL